MVIYSAIALALLLALNIVCCLLYILACYIVTYGVHTKHNDLSLISIISAWVLPLVSMIHID
jgi:hypothetical protein